MKEELGNGPGQRVPIISFFTGAGFLDLGFLLSKRFHSVWHNEYDRRFVAGFEYGMEALSRAPEYAWLQELEGVGTVQAQGSIEDFGGPDIEVQAFGGQRPTTFGVIGGPPCPDFSVGGKNAGGSGENGRLSLSYVDRILELKPAFFLFENVPGLYRTKKHRAFLKSLMHKLGPQYALDYNILNALEYGAPQDRSRFFMVGLQWDYIARQRLEVRRGYKGWFPWPAPTFPGAKGWKVWPTQSPVGLAMEKPPEIPNELTVWHWINDERLPWLPNGREGFKPKSKKFEYILEGDDSRKSFKRLHRFRYSPTLAYGNNEVHLHPTKPRRLTVREALRLQTVPDAYALPEDMPLSHKFKTIGNGVPVVLARAMAGAFADLLDGVVRPGESDPDQKFVEQAYLEVAVTSN